VVKNLFCYIEDDTEIRGQMSKEDERTCINLLKSMELEGYNHEMEIEEIDSEVVEQETLGLPEEWIYSCIEGYG
jgi:hypothetical protein